MHIHCLDVTVNNKDLSSLISKYVPAGGKISNIRAEFKDHQLVFSGQVRLLLPVNFQAGFELSHTKNQISAKLVKIRPMSGLMDQFKKKIMLKIEGAASFLHLDDDNEAVQIHINDILKNQNITADMAINKLSILENQLILKLQGTLDL